MSKYTHKHGGVGAPVGLTVFKTAGGSLGAVPGGFDSHTPPLRCQADTPLDESQGLSWPRFCKRGSTRELASALPYSTG